ncbi:MAG: DUF3099 domain-containing protein [Actinobacteria bacterium]|nr:DUF3099 domain-containing protein [Actinomycetota bacterium]
MSPVNAQKPALITSARRSRTLDTHDRQVRYLWTMGVRVACFIAATLTPLPWNLLLLLAAAVLPTIAVMLANAIDQREPVAPAPAEPQPRRELPSADTVKGTVEDE